MNAAPDLAHNNFPEDSLLSKVEIIGERAGPLYETTVPIGLILKEDVAVDEAHVAQLVKDMEREANLRGGTGQEAAMVLGEVPGLPYFLVIDGFHRDKTLRTLGRLVAAATIRPDCTIEDVTDQRILAANRHANVSFARTADWIQSAWQRSPWAAELTVVQAFSLKLTNKLNKGNTLALSREDEQAVIQWVTDKCNKWEITAVTAHTTLTSAAIAAPDLVRSARRRKGGHILTDLTPQHVSAVAKILPHRHSLQRMVAEIAKQNNLTVLQARAAAQKFESVKTDAEARDIAATTNWSTIKAPSVKKRRAPRKQEPEQHVTEQHDTEQHGAKQRAIASREFAYDLLLSELELGRTSLENLVLTGRYSVPRKPAPAPEFQISYAGDMDMVALVRPVQSQLPADFAAAIDEVRPRIIQQISAKYELAADEALELIEAAKERVVSDMTQGDLKYMRPAGKITFFDLLNRCLFDALQEKDSVGKESVGPTTELVRDPTIIDLEPTLRAFPRLPHIMRRVIVQRGILHFSPATIMSLARSQSTERVGNVNFLLQEPGTITNEVLHGSKK